MTTELNAANPHMLIGRLSAIAQFGDLDSVRRALADYYDARAAESEAMDSPMLAPSAQANRDTAKSLRERIGK